MPERPKFDSQTLKRLLSYMRAYKGTLVLVTVCILLSAVAGAASSMFLQKLIDEADHCPCSARRRRTIPA